MYMHVFLGLAVLSTGLGKLVAQEATSDFDVLKKVQLTQNAGGYYRIYSDLGILPMASKGRVKLVVHNVTGQAIKIGTYFSGCSCVSASVSAQEVGVDETFEIDLIMETKRITKRSEQMVAFSIARNRDGTDDISLRLAYEIEGLVAFRDKIAHVEVANEQHQAAFDIPLIVESPAEISKLQVEASAPYRNMRHDIKVSDGRVVLKCTLDLTEMPNLGYAGEVHLHDLRTGLSDTLLLLVNRKAEVRIAPIPLRFRGTAGRFATSFIVRIDSKSDSAANRMESAGTIHASANLAGAEITATTQRLGNGTARVSLDLILEEKVEGKLGEELFVILRMNGRRYLEKCDFVILDNMR